jgi:hypothetical protein
LSPPVGKCSNTSPMPQPGFPSSHFPFSLFTIYSHYFSPCTPKSVQRRITVQRICCASDRVRLPSYVLSWRLRDAFAHRLTNAEGVGQNGQGKLCQTRVKGTINHSAAKDSPWHYYRLHCGHFSRLFLVFLLTLQSQSLSKEPWQEAITTEMALYGLRERT